MQYGYFLALTFQNCCSFDGVELVEKKVGLSICYLYVELFLPLTKIREGLFAFVFSIKYFIPVNIKFLSNLDLIYRLLD